MKRVNLIPLSLILITLTFNAKSQINENEVGAWYMAFLNTDFEQSRFGVQGDIQYRNWDLLGDLEQLLIRGGVTYRPENFNVKLTLGVANITSGAYGDNTATTSEDRIYQELLMPQKLGDRFYLTHRFRYEQRFVDDQDFRTRIRYNLFLNVPLNQTNLSKGAIYLSAYNEIFINGERDIGNGNQVEIFDRNRAYAAVGYSIADNSKIQFGYMRQKTNNWSKGQVQLSLHHNF